MAVIALVTKFVERGVLQSTWLAMGNADTGMPENLDRFPIHSVQFGGTFGGATVVLEGSDDGVTYFTLTGENPSGGADVLISTTSAQRFDFYNVVPHFIRPRTSGGSGTAINVIVTSKSFGH